MYVGRSSPAVSFAAASERPRRRIKVRSRRPPPEAPKLARIYADALPAPNVLARVYLYEWLVRFENVEALGWPAQRIDAVHCWDNFFVQQVLQRIAVHLAGLTELGSGQPAAGFGRLIRALRRHAQDAEAPAPWNAAHALLEHAEVPSCVLEEVDVALPLWRRPSKRAPEPEPLPSRRTRSMTRLVDAVASLDDDEMDVDTPSEGTRCSRRAEQLAAKKRSEDLRQRAKRVLGPSVSHEDEAEEEEEEGEPIHLETKVACLVRLCDLLSTPRGTPASSGLHRLVQPLLDGLPTVEKEMREHVAHVQSECDAAMKALQKRAPSMVSQRYDAWQEEGAQAEQYLALRRHAPRGGALGRDLDGNEYWHLCPIVPPHHEWDVSVAGATPHFSGHWSQVLVIYGRSPGGELRESEGEASGEASGEGSSEAPALPAETGPKAGGDTEGRGADATTAAPHTAPEPAPHGFYGTADATAIRALRTYLHHRMERADLSDEAAAAQSTLLANLAQVQTYMAWAAAELA